MTINSLKKLSLTLDDTNVECQLTTAQLVDEPEGAETLTTFCGSRDIAGTPKYTLNLAGFQDYGHSTTGGTPTNDSVFDMLHTSYRADVADPGSGELDVVLTVGSAVPDVQGQLPQRHARSAVTPVPR